MSEIIETNGYSLHLSYGTSAYVTQSIDSIRATCKDMHGIERYDRRGMHYSCCLNCSLYALARARQRQSILPRSGWAVS